MTGDEPTGRCKTCGYRFPLKRNGTVRKHRPETGLPPKVAIYVNPTSKARKGTPPIWCRGSNRPPRKEK